MNNPFITKALGPEHPFCNRIEEQEDLLMHARNSMNVVLFGPRRYGKTSLVKRVQHRLKEDGFCIIYSQFFKLRSIEDLTDRLARSIFQGIHAHESLFDKGRRWLKIFSSFRMSLSPTPDGGFSFSVEPARQNRSPLEILEDLLQGLTAFLESFDGRTCIALDEFQDISDFKDPRVEATLREHIQHHQASFIFLGSRRRLLQDIFTNSGRPFYQSAIMRELSPLPRQELGRFISDQFETGGKTCPPEIALNIAARIECYPYYAQALAYWSFALSEPVCTTDTVETAFSNLLGSERYGFEAIFQSLTGPQASLIRAIAMEPVQQPTSRQFLQTFGLSAGGVQKSLNSLSTQDLIERPDPSEPWKVTDPVFRQWILEMFAE